MQNKSQGWRILLIPFPLGILLTPSTLTALTWTAINFEVTLGMILVTVIVYFFATSWKWYPAVLAALTIAFPPYPYLIDFSGNGKIIVRSTDIYFPGAFYSSAVFLVALLCFKLIFWILTVFRRHAS